MRDMLNVDSFIRIFNEMLLEYRQKRFLVAVSGGPDSMVLLDLMYKAGMNITIAHCNFNLRGEDSIKDKLLVQNYCEKYALPFESIEFETEKHASENGISIQIAARELRYEWFKMLVNTHDLCGIVTAHHLDDAIESSLFNLIQGTGIKGLKGMPQSDNGIYRPLLNFGKSEILKYAELNQVPWREDRSNQSDTYRRNFIRHHIIPEILKINPGFQESWQRSRRKFIATEALLDFHIGQLNKHIEKVNGLYILPGKCLDEIPENARAIVLHGCLKPFSFNYSQTEEILQSQRVNERGGVFYSEGYELITDRNDIKIKKKDNLDVGELTISKGEEEVRYLDRTYSFEIVKSGEWKITPNRHLAQIDMDKLRYPLTLRTWKHGDKIVPLGMKGRKKVSDIFIDNKTDLFDKRKTAVLESGGELVWVAGCCLSDHFKITDKTKKIQLIREIR